VNIPGNLISDSTLVNDTFEFVNDNGGRASFLKIAETIFSLGNISADLAGSLVRELIQNDQRFVVEADYLSTQPEPSNSALLRDLEFVVLDVEAAQERKMPARIIEIGAYRVCSGKVVAEFETLVNPETSVPKFLANLTGISDEMLTSAPTFPEIAHAFLDFIGDSVLVAHNANFDLPLLNREINRVFAGQRLRNTHLCTVDLARRLVPQLESHRLDSVAAYFQVAIPRRHRAADDALATAHVFVRLLNTLAENGISTLPEARRFQAKLPEAELALAFDA
jgi:DNA polymerase III epsilon subunit family exonuclease